MNTAISIPAPQLALLAAVTAVARSHTGLDEHPLTVRAMRHRSGCAPITVSELEQAEQRVEQVRSNRPHSALLMHVEPILYTCWSLAACELPVVGTGADMRWPHGVHPGTEVHRAWQRVRGEPVEEPAERGPRVFIRPSQRGEDPKVLAAEHRRNGLIG